MKKKTDHRNYFSIFALNPIRKLKLKAFPGIILTASLGILIFSRCAHQGSLAGGPKDIVPPTAIEAEPPDRTTSFSADRITITFYEFITLKNPAKEIFISPPMQTRPEYKAQGKKLVVEFKEELKSNSTYTINFGNSVTDFTEGNVLSNFEYVFSTGLVIDSLSISGRVLNAFDLKPEADIIAMVYTDDNDTLPLDSLPIYVPPKSASRTDKEGKFRINNLAPGAYKLIALQDLNNNFYYDLPNERMAFLDSLVRLKPPEKDTLFDEEPDTTFQLPGAALLSRGDVYELYMFEKVDSSQKLLGKKHIGSGKLQYVFRMPVDTFLISLADDTTSRQDWYIPEFSKNRDTVDLWLKPGLPDTLEVRMFAGDSISDTSKFYLSQPERGGKQKKEDLKYVKFIPSTRAGALNINQELRLVFSTPLQSIDTTRILLKSTADSLSPSVIFENEIRRAVTVQHQWIPGEAYKLILDDSAFTDQSGLVNDSIMLSFKVRSPEDYGLLMLNIEIPDAPGVYIIQLMDAKEAVLKELTITKSGIVRFEYLIPGNYKVKAIHDINQNGKWNPGDYKKNLLPEKVQYYPNEISIRANWDLQEDWQLKSK
jgi:uncharacterized protein (DUF2141 family)